MNFFSQLSSLFGDLKEVIRFAVNQVESWLDLISTLGVAVPAIIVVFGVIVVIRAWGIFGD